MSDEDLIIGKKPVASKRRFIHGKAQLNIECRARKRLIRETMEAWFEVDPEAAKDASKYLHEISKVQHGRMRTEAAKRAGMKLKLTFPQDLYILLKNTFMKFLPDQEPFAHDDSDWDLCYQLFPNFMPRRKC